MDDIDPLDGGTTYAISVNVKHDFVHMQVRTTHLLMLLLTICRVNTVSTVFCFVS
jgi:hypothetical protein